MITTVLFDLDGTLVDTEPLAARVVKEIFSGWKIPLTHEDAGLVTGRTWAEALTLLFKKHRPPVDEVRATEEILSRYQAALEDDCTEVPGAIKAVQLFASHGLKLGVVSGSWRADIEFSLKKLGLASYIQVLVGAEDCSRGKPQPEGYLKGMNLLGLKDPRQGLVFEDSVAGIAAARAAGLWVTALTSTNHFSQDQSQAHWKITDFTQVDSQWLQHIQERT